MISLVADLLAAANIVQPPVRLPQITPLLGIICHSTHKVPAGSDAVLIRGKRLSLVAYSPLPPITRRRFSIAHEIGHHLLHRGRGMRPDDPRHRADMEMELEADAFAAELLMPTAWMLDACLESPTFDHLRDLFWVSRQAMRWRLYDLGLLIPRNRRAPSFAAWSTLDRDTALALYHNFDWFHPALLHASPTGDPYADYLLMRGVYEAGHPPLPRLVYP